MDCYCSSKNLYSNQENEYIEIEGEKVSACRTNSAQMIDNEIKMSILQSSSIYTAPYIQKISFHQIKNNPLWFYQDFIALNRPCIITQALEDIKQIEKWTDPHQFLSDIQKQKIIQISTSITPDGFADSIKNEYFIEPYQIKTSFKDIIKWGQQEESTINPKWIPYVQHQNSNLTQEMSNIHSQINHESRNYLSQTFFKNKQPDAQNLWMGYKNSVSSLHKDHYQNFYSVLIGEKHFTLMPPISILYLPEKSYQNSKWTIQNSSLTIKTNNGIKTRWISCNPDLDKDCQRFPYMSKLKDFNYHVIVQAGQMLYLPSLWYHQVSQYHQKQPYVIAMNYWFDMQFNQNYTLYQTARKLNGYC